MLGRPLTYHAGGEVGPALGAARLARLAESGGRPDEVCAPPPVDRVVEPEEALAGRLVGRLERWRALYRILRPEMRRFGRRLTRSLPDRNHAGRMRRGRQSRHMNNPPYTRFDIELSCRRTGAAPEPQADGGGQFVNPRLRSRPAPGASGDTGRQLVGPHVQLAPEVLRDEGRPLPFTIG